MARTRAVAMAKRVAGKDEGNGKGVKRMAMVTNRAIASKRAMASNDNIKMTAT